MQQEHIINQRSYISTLPITEELHFEANRNYLFELPFLGGLTVRGDRDKEFLQGQLSCDIRQITSTAMRQGALCNLKGRILALLDVIDWDGLQLILPKDLLLDTQKSLSTAAMLSRVKLEPTKAYQVYGLYLANPNDELPIHFHDLGENYAVIQNDILCGYHLSHHLYILLIKNEEIANIVEPFRKRGQLRGSFAWHYLQLSHKQVQIYPETRGLFLPHRLDLHLSGYLSFDKGCYKGQEIIARTHYRAKIKHGLRLFIIENTAPLAAGKKLFEPSGQVEVGELIDFSPLGNGRYLIAASILLEHPSHVCIENQSSTVELNPFG
ncbi:glycine cleavage T protein [Legionella lansingensis]|uniref:Glycine cleavage T protein n=1 Tax=Legionella lansingensis TaxID=45067 RepID=A0A0W0VJK3_9GAMM|nr:hypothetical protein [Legionella lansingensis]KTD20283.1 glycine cleavage T protein [Legionella lansingensis]SNV50311.1 glycine cleavage T protein [Legionella lansingensis]